MLPRFAIERHYLTLLLCLPLLACCTKEKGSGGGLSGDFEPGPNPGVPTLIDDEDFDGKIPVTFYASSAINCIRWKYADRNSGSQTLINKMLVYMAGACQCPFSRAYITAFESKCDSISGSLLVSTNITLPYNQPHDQFVNYLKNWIKTEPNFGKVLKDEGTITVYVVNIEFTHISSPGSGDAPSDPPPSEPTDPDKEDSGESGSASGEFEGDEDDDFESSSVTISTDIYQLLLACITVLGLLHLVNNS